MFESFILGMVQGVTEWLPVSSEGMIVLVKNNFFGGGILADTIKMALFLHLGTFLAALIYFRRDVKSICLWINDLRSRLSTGGIERDREAGKILRFIIIATLVSALLGWGLLEFITGIENSIVLTARFVNIIIAVLLVFTGVAQLKKRKNDGHRSAFELKDGDSILLGVAQGAAVLPGLSRSGLTVFALLLRNFQDAEALRLSFLLSLPIVLGGNILLNFNEAIFSLNNLVALLSSFIFGYIMINLFLKLAEKINFGWFAIIFAGLVFLAVFL
jgi:undecaprenyl-diphosphatase